MASKNIIRVIREMNFILYAYRMFPSDYKCGNMQSYAYRYMFDVCTHNPLHIIQLNRIKYRGKDKKIKL